MKRKSLTMLVFCIYMQHLPAQDLDELLADDDTLIADDESAEFGTDLSSLNTESGGEITLESRIFQDDNKTKTDDYGIGSYFRLQQGMEYDWLSSNLRIAGRVDSVDKDRNLVYFEEAWVQAQYYFFNLKVGSQLFNWSATEAFHPAEIINARNFDSNLENAEKIGTLAVSLEALLGNFSVSGYYLPYYQLPNYPGTKSRLQFYEIPDDQSLGSPLKIDEDGNISNDDYGHQFGGRVRYSGGSFDLTFHYLELLSNIQPLATVNLSTSELQLLYPRLKQAGSTLQWALGPWLIKSEIAYRHYPVIASSVQSGYASFINGAVVPFTGPAADHVVVAFGLEYGFDIGNGAELTFLTEGQFLGGKDINRDAAAQLDIFQSDILGGVRLAMNDLLDRALLVSIIGDLERDQELLLNISYSQRITEQWSIAIGGRAVYAPSNSLIKSGLQPLHESNQIYLNLSRYF
jgi:hypothetical protein